jgi:hypothetical protein
MSQLPIAKRTLDDECQEFFYGWSDHIWWSIDVIRNAFLSVDQFQPDNIGPWIPLLKLYNVVIEQGDYLGIVTNVDVGKKLSIELVNHVHQARLLILILVQNGRGVTPVNAWDPFYEYAESRDPAKIELKFGFGAGGAFNYFPVPYTSPVGNVAPIDVTDYKEVGYTKPYPNGITFDEAWDEWLKNGQRVSDIYTEAFGLSIEDSNDLSMCMIGHLVSTIVEYVELLNARNKFISITNNSKYFTGPESAKVPTFLMSNIMNCIGIGETGVFLDSNGVYNFYKAREGALFSYDKYGSDADFETYYDAMNRCLSLADDTAEHLYNMGYLIRYFCEKYCDKKYFEHYNDRFEYVFHDYFWWVGLYIRAQKGRPYINMGMLQRLYNSGKQLGDAFGLYTTVQAGTELGILIAEHIDLLVNYRYCSLKETVDNELYISPGFPQTTIDSAEVLKQISVKIAVLISSHIGGGDSILFSTVFDSFSKFTNYEKKLISVITDPSKSASRKLEASLGGVQGVDHNLNEVHISEHLYEYGELFGNIVVTAMENNLNTTGLQVNFNSLNMNLTMMSHNDDEH